MCHNIARRKKMLSICVYCGSKYFLKISYHNIRLQQQRNVKTAFKGDKHKCKVFSTVDIVSEIVEVSSSETTERSLKCKQTKNNKKRS